MWVAKLKLRHKDCLTFPKCMKYNVTMYGYSLGMYEKDGVLHHTVMELIEGSENNKAKYVEAMRKDKRVGRLETAGDVLILEELIPMSAKFHEVFASREIFYIKPCIVRPGDRYEHWEIASWNKKNIMKFLEYSKNHMEVHLEKIKQSKIHDVFIPHALPKLTKKQKRTLEIASRMGYFSVPHKTDLKTMAKAMKVSKQAFQEHLRKAEYKLMPALMESA